MCVAQATEDFPIGASLTAKLAGLADELEYGKGLAMVRNMPVDDPRLGEGHGATRSALLPTPRTLPPRRFWRVPQARTSWRSCTSGSPSTSATS